MYSCGLLASDCVQCVADYSKDYNCRFCTNSCAYSSDTLCENESIADTSTCLARNTEIVEVIVHCPLFVGKLLVWGMNLGAISKQNKHVILGMTV